ncbi:MAG: peptidoglycan DD-metalloendopeptidase family protein [Pseudomonadota bacterium]
MSILEITSIGLQILLPFTLLAWMVFAPVASRIGFLLRSAAVLSSLIALALTALWMIPPWWVPYIYLSLWLIAFVWGVRRVWQNNSVWPRRLLEYLSLAVLLPLGLWAATLTFQALAGRTPPLSVDVVDLPLPLGPGTYLVANGGATEIVNGHLLTLDPKTERQRAYRGQSYAVDLVKVNGLGLRASGWRPANPESYLIFGEPVFAPCEGTVIGARDGIPDMPVPIPDLTLLEGNHVVLDCGKHVVLLAHFRQGSVKIESGDPVGLGQHVGDVGNSGRTFEPHLHIHAQRPADPGQPMLSGEPLHISLNGEFLVRNDRTKLID